MPKPPYTSSTPLVAIVVCHGQGLFELGCAVGLFAPLAPTLDAGWYRLQLCAGERGALRTAAGTELQLAHGLEVLEQADIVLVPGWRDPEEAPPPALLAALARAHGRGARIASICSGAFVLAWAGLLDGRSATTHWHLTETLAKNFRAVSVRDDVLYVDAGSVITSAGSASGMDMLLHMVRQDYGARVANLVAERLVLAPWRDGERRQRVRRAIPLGEPTRLARLLEWIRDNLQQEHSLRSLAEQALLSPRTLQRQFIDATGLSPIDWVIRERVMRARELLEATDRPLQWVAEHAGFGSLESLRRHFRSHIQQSPASYRSLSRQGRKRTAGSSQNQVESA